MFLLLTSLFSCFDRSLTQGQVLDPVPEDLLGIDLFSMQASTTVDKANHVNTTGIYHSSV